jgi:hypothetical protein
VAPYTDYPRASYLVQMSGMDLCLTPTVRGPSPQLHSLLQSSGRRPRHHIGSVDFPVSGTPLRLQSQGAGTCYATGLGCLILTRASRNDAGRMSSQGKQDSNPGGWRKGRFITLADQHLDISKNDTGLIAQGCRVFMLRMWKQASKKDKSRCGISLLLGGCNISY